MLEFIGSDLATSLDTNQREFLMETLQSAVDDCARLS